MASSSRACFLVDFRGMELLLGRRHPTWTGPPWALLSGRRAAPGEEVELCLFGCQSPPAAAGDSPGLRLVPVPEPLADFPVWLKRDARRRESACWYCLVSDEAELRRQARRLGLALLDPADLPRRLGLAPPPGGAAVARGSAAARDPRPIKGGKDMSPAEAAWWTARMGLPGDRDETAADTPGSEAVVEGEGRRFARLMGADPEDPRVLRHDDEDWLEREFPDEPAPDASARRPRSRAPRRR